MVKHNLSLLAWTVLEKNCRKIIIII